MARGQEYPSSPEMFVDNETGVEMLRVSQAPTINMNMYFHVPFFTPDSRTFIFQSKSQETGQLDLYRIDVDGTDLIQLTDVPGVNGIVISPCGRRVYYMVRGELRSVTMDTFDEEILLRSESAIGANPFGAISSDGRYYANICSTEGGTIGIVRFATDGSDAGIIHEREGGLSHIQYEPWESKDILFQIPASDETTCRLHLIRDDGTDERELAITLGTGHQVWMGKTKRVLSTQLPHHWAIVSIAEGDPAPKEIASGTNFWHCGVSDDAQWAISDTNWPDTGLQLVNVRTGKFRTLCHPKSTSGHPQWSHPHPAFSPDGKKVVFNSDRTGIPHVFVAQISEDFLQGTM